MNVLVCETQKRQPNKAHELRKAVITCQRRAACMAEPSGTEDAS